MSRRVFSVYYTVMTTETQKKRILLVDDDPLIVRMYERKLVKEGFEVLLAPNGEEGIKAIEKNRPDLVLLDVLMPKMNGWEVLKKLKSSTETADIPVITLTSLGDRPDDIQKFKELGVKEYFIKSQIELKDLIAAIRKYI